MQELTLPDANVKLYADALPPDVATKYLSALFEHVPWRSEEITIWGRRVLQPRLVAWYGEPGAVYKYSGSTLHPLPWSPLLIDLRQRVERLAAARFNSVLLNLYRDERDAMGWHSDDESELGERPTIASLSLGETREFQLRHKRRKDLPVVRLGLTSGSLLVMAGDTQTYWQHSVKRETAKLGKRINLTFRSIGMAQRPPPDVHDQR